MSYGIEQLIALQKTLYAKVPDVDNPGRYAYMPVMALAYITQGREKYIAPVVASSDGIIEPLVDEEYSLVGALPSWVYTHEIGMWYTDVHPQKD